MAQIGLAEQLRYQVFVSSTYLDLKEERRAVTSALLGSDAFPAGMELFPATDDDAWTLIQRVIDDSDYYLLVIGGKYGSIDPVDDISFTEKEYDYAVSVGKPVMAFIHGAPDDLPIGKSEKLEDMQARLASFISKVKGAHHINTWTSAEDLVGKVSVSFNKFIRAYPALGWVRADRAAASETLADLAKAQIRITELEETIFRERVAPPSGIEELAQGSDAFRVDTWVTGQVVSITGTVGKHRGTWFDADTTWDHVFAAIGPNLLVEAEEREITKALESWVSFNFGSEMHDALRADAAEDGETPDEDASPRKFEVSTTTNQSGTSQLGTILLQLKALGLIARSEKKRSVNDQGSYWTLTPFGEQSVIRVRAMKKTDTKSTAPVDGLKTLLELLVKPRTPPTT